MLDESRRRGSGVRRISENERRLVEFLVKHHPRSSKLLEGLRNAIVEDMTDGGMGSIRFANTGTGREFGSVAAEAEWLDEDDVPVSIAVNLDSEGDLYELDIWKVDFSPLRGYPRPEEVRPVEGSTR